MIIPLPIWLPDPQERIRFVHHNLQKLSKSTVPLATFLVLPMLGALPAWIVKLFATNLIATCLMTNFGAPFGQVHMMERPCDDIMFGGGLLVGNIGR